MNSLEILGIIIGTIFIYLLLSLLGTIINEWIIMLLNLKGKNLVQALNTMLCDSNKQNPDLINSFMENPLFKKFTIDGKKNRLPSKLSHDMFSQIIVHILTNGQNYRESLDGIEQRIKDIFPEGSETRSLLLSLVTNAGSNLDLFKKELEEWYNAVQDRAKGWYKRKTRYIAIIIGVVISIAFNANTFNIVNKLSYDPKVRAQITEQARAFIADNPNLNLERQATSPFENDSLGQSRTDSLYQQMGQVLKKDLSQVQTFLGMGWSQESWAEFASSPYHVFKTIAGWLITAIAISFGAPFWYDSLKKAVNLSSSGPVRNYRYSTQSESSAEG